MIVGLFRLFVVTVGLTLISWMMLIGVGDDQPPERILVLGVAWMCVLWGGELL